ncbi:MAG: Crp/Fnr family transcriptional regulator [Candidimonas sp.]|nr:MAG: Crp/Fnr family transcriptional regulator [Candidimonas sp.]
MSMSRIPNLLSQLPLFNELALNELDNIALGTSELRAVRGDKIFHGGEPCIGFHVVVYGRVKLALVSPEGNEKVVRIIGPGHSFGEALMFMEEPYIVSAQALEDTLLLHVLKSAVFTELARSPEFAKKMLAGLSRRLHSLMSDVEAYSLRSGSQRVIGYFFKCDVNKNGDHFVLDVGKAVIASRLNVTPEHFSRILRTLCERGLIAMSGRQITILDIEGLRSYNG